MAISRNTTPTAARFSVNLNIVLKDSKKMTPAQQEALLKVAQVRVLIVDAGNPDNVLVEETVEAREFSTGSVGYGLSLGDVKFAQ
jgi:hypothetical protein